MKYSTFNPNINLTQSKREKNSTHPRIQGKEISSQEIQIQPEGHVWIKYDYPTLCIGL